MEMLREKIKGLEGKIMEMIRHGQENVAIADRLHRWMRAILQAPSAASLPEVLVSTLRHEFMIPQAAVRLWSIDSGFEVQSFALDVSEDVRAFASSLAQPYCGLDSGFEAGRWLDDAGTVLSIALIPLRADGESDAFGLLVLGSPDPTRYSADMGTEFLARIGDMAAAALSRLRSA